MKKFINRSMAWLLTLVMCLSLLSGIQLPETQAATTVDYRYGSTSEYSQCRNIIYNWGTRGTTATFLSPNAEAFYEDNNTSYSTLSALSGSSTLSSVPSSTLYTTLRNLMTKNHTKVTTYDETRDMFAFTDCQGNAWASTKISSFYSGTPIGPAWDGGATWNREHTWPNSKGNANTTGKDNTQGEADIMMLRPASSSENSSRNNTAYGEGSSYYNPNKASNGKYDLRGDVARIVLYVYVRWQDTSKSNAVLFGTSGVIESKEVLLKWMEEDPVDTWEMGRNDSVESITGTRNVFVDYPELAFTLFGASVPSDLVTPSRGNGGGSSNTVTVRFMENGLQTKTLTVAPGEEVELPAPSITTNATYNFAGWTTKTVNETTTKPSNIYTAGATWAAAEQTFYALYTRVDTTTGGTSDVFTLHTGAITEGDYLLVSNGGAMSTAANGSSTRRDVVNVTISNNTISGPASNLIWHIAPYENSYTIYNAAETKYLAGTGYATAGLNLNKSITTYAPWTITPGNPAVITNDGNEAKGVNYTLRRNANNGFACYDAKTGTGITLYKAISGTTYYSTSCGTACTHTNTTTSTQAATCTATGKTTVTCASCGQVISTTVLPAIGHNYAGGYCTGCGQADPNGGSNYGDFVLVTPETVTEGQYVIGAVKSGKYPNLYLGTSAISGDWKVTTASVAVQNNTIGADALPTGTQVLTLTGNNKDGFTVGFEVNGTMQYLGYSSTSASRKLALGANYKNTLWKVVADPDGGVALSSNYGEKNYTISQNSTADTAIRGYYTGTIYTGLYLFRKVDVVAEPTVELTHVSLDPNNDALGYKAVAKNLPQGAKVQISLWVTEDIVVTKDATSLRLKNILANNGGEMTIYAKATIVDAEGNELAVSEVAQTTMKEVITIVNGMSDLGVDKEAAVYELYAKYAVTIDAWLGEDNQISTWG